MANIDTSFGPMFRIVARDCYVNVKEGQLVAVLGLFFRDWFVAFPYDALTCELVIRGGVMEIHAWEYESLFGDIKESGIVQPEEDRETIRYDSNAGKFVAKFDDFEG